MDLHTVQKGIQKIDYRKKLGKTVHLFFGIDDAFVEPMAVCALSILQANPDEQFIFHVIIDWISPDNLERLKQTALRHAMCIYLHFVDVSVFDSFSSSVFYTKAIYYRLLMPYLLEEDIDRALYLDADILCLHGFSSLWTMRIQDYVLAAVEDQVPVGTHVKHEADSSVERLRALGIPCHWYFNSGVMLVNLPLWRQEKVFERVLSTLQQYHKVFTLWDQDALNAVLHDNVLALEKKYNFMYSVCYVETPIPALEKISLLHYASRYKPWQAWCSHPLQKLYLQVRKQTAWADLSLMQPRNYKEMRSMGKSMWQRKRYKESFQWSGRYLWEKFKSKVQ